MEKSSAVAACTRGCLGEDQVERLCCGETEFYNEKEKRFTSLDLFLLHPPFSLKS